jgi:CheY-like chemotaxis protein
MDIAPPLRLLYIEDNEIIGLLMQERLSRHGYLVDLAKDGEEGLAKLHQTHYDLAIVDYLLPGMSGLQVL